MAFSLNRIMLIGNLGRDVETRFSGDTLSISSFSLATTHSYKGKDGNWVNETTWHNITAYNLSDFMKEQLKKGKKVYVEGRLKKGEYTDKEGVKRYTAEVISERIISLEGSGESSGNSDISSEGSTQDGSISPVDSGEDLPF